MAAADAGAAKNNLSTSTAFFVTIRHWGERLLKFGILARRVSEESAARFYLTRLSLVEML